MGQSEKDFTDIMKKIKEKKTLRPRAQKPQVSEEARYIKSLIDPVVTDFVAADEELMIQSSTSTSYFISYGLVYICRIEISTSDDEAHIVVTGSPSYSLSYSVKVDKIEETTIKHKMKDALLRWYKNCFHGS